MTIKTAIGRSWAINVRLWLDSGSLGIAEELFDVADGIVENRVEKAAVYIKMRVRSWSFERQFKFPVAQSNWNSACESAFAVVYVVFSIHQWGFSLQSFLFNYLWDAMQLTSVDNKMCLKRFHLPHEWVGNFDITQTRCKLSKYRADITTRSLFIKRLKLCHKYPNQSFDPISWQNWQKYPTDSVLTQGKTNVTIFSPKRNFG